MASGEDQERRDRREAILVEEARTLAAELADNAFAELAAAPEATDPAALVASMTAALAARVEELEASGEHRDHLVAFVREFHSARDARLQAWVDLTSPPNRDEA